MLIGKMIGQGRTAEVYEYKENKVVKLFKESYSKNAIKNEHRINDELYKNGIPVVKTYDLVEINGRYGIVYEYIKGPTMMKIMTSKPWKVDKLAGMLADLHLGLQNNIKSDIQSQKSRIKDSIALTDKLTANIKNKIYDYIDTLPDDNILCHGDLHPDNVLISKNQVIAIDWMDATKGNPLSDVATTSIMFKYAVVPEEKSYIEKCIINFIRHRFLSKYLKRYLEISGEKIQRIEEWELPMAAASLIKDTSNKEKKLLLDFIHKQINSIWMKSIKGRI